MKTDRKELFQMWVVENTEKLADATGGDWDDFIKALENAYNSGWEDRYFTLTANNI